MSNDSGEMEHFGSFIYKKHNGSDWELESTGFGGGRIIASQGSGSGSGGSGIDGGSGSGSGSSGTGSGSGSATIYTPNYHITDHLGSVRVVFAYNDGVPEILAQNDYYPFGLQHQNAGLLAGNDTNNRFLYNGKENQTTGALRLLDYGARVYDPEIIRFNTMDWLSEEFVSQSPFVYADNNPIRYIDFLGMNAQQADSTVMIDPVVVTAPSSNKDLKRWEAELMLKERFERERNMLQHPDKYSSIYAWWDSLSVEEKISHNRSEAFSTSVSVLLPQFFISLSILKFKGLKIKVPKGWNKRAAEGNGVIYQDPTNPRNNIRIMQGNPKSPNPSQQKPYVKYQKEGVLYDVNGNKVMSGGNAPEAHIRLDMFNQNIMPKF